MFPLNLNHCLGKNKDAEYTKQSSNTEVLKRGDVSNIFRTSHICEEHHLFDKTKFISGVVYTKRKRLITISFFCFLGFDTPSYALRILFYDIHAFGFFFLSNI